MDQEGLHQLEEQCIQEHVPACSATCPARVDVRGIITEVEKGNYPVALKLLRKSIPFPGIISRICDQPCRRNCVRKDAGEAISIALLEQACVELGGTPGGVPIIPKRDKHLAIIGGGVFGLTAACDLGKKGYPVTIFERSPLIGGAIRSTPKDILPDAVINHDFKILDDLGIAIHTKLEIDNISQNEQEQFIVDGKAFDAVLLAMGDNPSRVIDVEVAGSGIHIDPVSYETSLPGVFSGGLAAIGQEENVRKNLGSPIFILADGHRVATSIDRYFQRVSLTASRLREGSYETRLFTSIEDVMPSAAIHPKGGSFSPEEASEEASRCLKCQCLECVKVCEYLKEYRAYPKRYVREIYNNLSIVKGERKKNQFINSCSLCGLCGEVCPTDLDMGSVCLESRKMMVDQKRMPPSAHDFALRDMQFSNSQAVSLFKLQPGRKTNRYMFFPGCQLTASNPEYVEILYEKLRNDPQINENGGIGLALHCCGAPARWAGRTDLLEKTKAEFLGEFEKMGKPELILACSSCFQVFKENFPEIKIQSLWTILEEKVTQKEVVFGLSKKTISIHDPCTTRYETPIHDGVRSLISRMNFDIEELPLNREKTECCSYGGLMWLANPPLAKKVINRRINENQNAFVTYCVMCRDFFSRAGKETYHILDLLLNPNLESINYSPPDFSQRHRNRIKLKEKMLMEVWGEVMTSEKDKYKLNILKEVQSLLEERLILEEDIQEVLNHVEETGSFLENPDTKHRLASYCPGYVTYWVEYSKSGDIYSIHNAYSHRMSITEGTRS